DDVDRTACASLPAAHGDPADLRARAQLSELVVPALEYVLEVIEPFEEYGRPPGHREHRVLGNAHGEAGLLLDEIGEPAQEDPSAAERHAVLDEVAGELRARLLERRADGVHDVVDGVLERLADLTGGEEQRAGATGDEHPAL